MGREHSSWVIGILGVGKLMVSVVGTSHKRRKESYTRSTGMSFLNFGSHNPALRTEIIEATMHGVLPKRQKCTGTYRYLAYRELPTLQEWRGRA